MLGQLPDDPLIQAQSGNFGFPTARERPTPGRNRLLALGGAGLKLVVGRPVQGQNILGKWQLAAQLLDRRDQAL